MDIATRIETYAVTHIFFALFFSPSHTKSQIHDIDPSVLPTGFLYGTASSSYQYEGAYKIDGKGLSNWDKFSHEPGNIIDGSNGDVAVDHYHRYQEDISLMEALGVNSYRFSISWARILPKGRLGDINFAGIQYYNRLIDKLLQKGIKPFVTLTHFDIPQELEDRYGGWLSPESQEDFGYYADVCFRYFGDRVKYWVTMNEPNVQVTLGYRWGQFPPTRCSAPFGNCSSGNSEEDPFTAAHNMILAHANAVDTYRRKYQKEQGGTIEIVLHVAWFEPRSNSIADKLAAERAISFSVNWFLDPIIFGRHPAEMVKLIGSLLPEFSRDEKEKLQNGLDFIGINQYTSYYAQDCISASCDSGIGVTETEGLFRQYSQRNGIPIGELTSLEWLTLCLFRSKIVQVKTSQHKIKKITLTKFIKITPNPLHLHAPPPNKQRLNVYPEGMEKAVNYIRDRYNNTPMFITENGMVMATQRVPTSEKKTLQDRERVNYMDGYLNSLLSAVRKGADVRGYFAWSLLDNFEWKFGYTVRFGLHHVDYKTLKRTPKLSATWFQQFIAKHKFRRMLHLHDPNIHQYREDKSS